MIKRSLQQIEKMVGGKLLRAADADVQIKGVSIDSRNISTMNLFVPIVGERFDGHQFVLAAVQNGAVATFWQKDHANIPENIPVIIVDDTLEALQKLAASYRQELDVKVVAITGSNGKTTTKDLTAAVLSTAYKVHKTYGNLNNEYGLPLTLLQMEEDTEFAVLELGMSGLGEIACLTNIAKPDAAVITNIGEAHLEQLGSREAIAEAKLEILQGLNKDGVFVYYGDEPLLQHWIERRRSQDSVEWNVFRFGSHPTNDYAPIAVMMDDKGSQFTLNGMPERIFRIPIWGRHNVINAASAVAIGRYFGISLDLIQTGLSKAELTGMRVEVTRTKAGITVLNDAYNASPSSMYASIALLEELSGFKRKIAVFGDMLELGDKAENYHREIGEALDPNRIDRVLTYGQFAAMIGKAAGNHFPTGNVLIFQDKEPLIKELLQIIASGDVILLKGSRGMHLEEVAQQVISNYS